MAKITPLYYTVNQAAEALSVTPLTIRRAIMKGRLRSAKIGMARVIPHDALADYLANGLLNPATREHVTTVLNRHAESLGLPDRIDPETLELVQAAMAMQERETAEAGVRDA